MSYLIPLNCFFCLASPHPHLVSELILIVMSPSSSILNGRTEERSLHKPNCRVLNLREFVENKDIWCTSPSSLVIWAAIGLLRSVAHWSPATSSLHELLLACSGLSFKRSTDYVINGRCSWSQEEAKVLRRVRTRFPINTKQRLRNITWGWCEVVGLKDWNSWMGVWLVIQCRDYITPRGGGCSCCGWSSVHSCCRSLWCSIVGCWSVVLGEYLPPKIIQSRPRLNSSGLLVFFNGSQ